MNSFDSEQQQNASPNPSSTNIGLAYSSSGAPLEPPSSDTVERWARTPKPRGRQPRDPHAQSIKFQCRNVDDVERSLREYLEQPTVPAEHATIEFVFPVSSAFMVYTADIKGTKQSGQDIDKQQPFYGKLDRTAISVMDALAPAEDSREQMRSQKAIAKVCVEACERADGFRYSFHNNWLSREDEACRFSFFCNDSTLNKGRAANEGAGSHGKKMRKAVYDCQGLIAVKFSATKQSLEVHYKHIPLHKTYAERAPPPRRDSKRRKLMEIFEPGNLPADRRNRTTVPVPSADQRRPSKRRATEPAPISMDAAILDLTRAENLQPIVEFLGSTDGPPTIETEPDTDIGLRHNTTSETAVPQSVAKPVNPTSQTAHSAKSRRPALPGTMAGSLKSGHLNWKASASNDTNVPPRTEKQASKVSFQNSDALPSSSDSVTVVASLPSTSIALSEIETLKRKLEEAEARIKKLESEKPTVVSSTVGAPQHVLWPPPPGYLPIPPDLNVYPLVAGSSYQIPNHQAHIRHSPQTSSAASIGDRESTSSHLARNVTSRSVAVPSTAHKSSQARTVGTKFVLYTPKKKTKQPPTHNQLPSNNATSTEPSSMVEPGSDTEQLN